MKKRFLVMICVVVVIVCVCAFWFFTPISLEKSNEYPVGFSVDTPSKLLEEAITRLPLSGRWYTLDFMSIEYETAENRYAAKSVQFGFSHDLGFDLFGASCIRFYGSSVKSKYMKEEAKTIYDDLYEGMAYV